MKPVYFDSLGYFIGTIPSDCVADCVAQGDVTESVRFWVKRLLFHVPREKAIPYIREFGAYTEEELNNLSQERINCFCLWQACCDMNDGGEYYGLVH